MHRPLNIKYIRERLRRFGIMVKNNTHNANNEVTITMRRQDFINLYDDMVEYFDNKETN